ncbi:zinc ribbon domain-containing protein [Micromonospora marina]|uniref:Recombinase zinc beta ribbon domain-containing protein n=1 Tax=Micromonospora marina TaxID=307120 RepID=A0A1C4YXA3_9ACTN|nr:zinc ribbon domain-containing protein [Micromonospora marina]SCF25314.1 Recombinase zinc beta ribbon domain-containing protein [Micromonospora marina]
MVLEARGEAHSQRAASDYDPTRRIGAADPITCPRCGCKYVVTSATGKLRRYRYYTCFIRARYGPAGCCAARIDADLLDDGVAEALIDFIRLNDLTVKLASSRVGKTNSAAIGG